MGITARVKVLRHMKGDKDYEPGQFRTLPVADAERLAETGAVEIVSKPAMAPAPRGKAKAAPKNKMQRAPANKAGPSTKAK